MAFYQCFKDISRNVYCSSYKVKNHAEGAAWVGQAITHFGLRSNDLLGQPYQSDDIPKGARTYPDQIDT